MNIAENFKHLPRTQKIALLFLTIYSVAIFYYGIRGALKSSSDQQSIYTTSKLLMQKVDPSQMTTDYLKSTNTDATFSDIDRHGGRIMYPPSIHVLLIPFYAFLLSPVLSKYCWLFSNIMCLGIIYYVLCVRYLHATASFYKYILLCVLIGAASTKTNLGLGQTSLFSCAAFLLTLLLKDDLALTRPDVRLYRIQELETGQSGLTGSQLSAWVISSPTISAE